MSGESKPVHPSAGEVAEDGVQVLRDTGTGARRTGGNSMDGPFKVGDKIEIADADVGGNVRGATIIRFLSDEQQGMSPEIEEYIAFWIVVRLDGLTGDAAKQVVMFGTDSQYWMNGRHVLLRKA
jgi:hypothetical protein